MPIRRAKDPQALYDEVAEHDLVVCPDNPLADAVNRRLAEPRLGTFATTPRRLATGRREPAEDRTAFLALLEDVDAPWKALSHAVGNVLQCWEHQGSHDAVLEYDAYVDGTTRAVVDAIADLDTTSSRLTEYEIPPETSVAVIGESQLTALERSILPEEYVAVDPFTDEAFAHPEFHVFDSTAAIVDAVLDTVAGENAERVAVVLDSSSRFSSLVEAALAANDVPHYGGAGFADDPDHRAFLGLLRAAFRGSDTTVGDVRPLLTRLGVDLPVDHDEKRVDALDLRGLDWLATFRDDVGSIDFGDALARFERRLDGDRELSAFREELAALGLADEPVTRARVSDLEFYLRRYEVPVDRDNEGVLLADATAAAFVDRPVVFHLGMDEGWTHSPPRRPWVDADDQFDRHLRDFQLLLQSGRKQYYLVRDTAGGRPVTPTPYLGELLDEEFERFSDLDAVPRPRVRPRSKAADLRGNGDSPARDRRGNGAGPGGYGHDGDGHDGDGQDAGDRDGTGFERGAIDVAPTELSTISQSSLNAYVNCPRDYYFSRLLDGPDRDYFTEGTLFHDFAEFCVEHPDLLDERAIDDVVDLIHREAAPFYHEDETPLRRRKYRVGVEAIASFLDANAPEADALDFLTPTSGWGTNPFAEHFGVSLDSSLAERWFENVPVGAKGKIDLVRAPGHLVDHKSGRQKSARSVVRASAVDPPHDAPNFQAAMYLSHFRTENPGERIDFSFFHFLEPLDVAISDDGDLDGALEDALTTVTYRPTSFDAFAESREAYDELCNHYKDCAATFDDLGYERYREIVAELSVPDTTDREKLRASNFAAVFTAAVDGATGDDVDAEKGCDQAMRCLNGLRKRSFFAEDLDAFEAFLAERIDEINARRAGEERFPIEGPAGEPNYRRVDHRDLMLEGESRE